jgi:hypothetical protein
LSIERGFGETCYRIFKLNKTSVPEINPIVNQELILLKFEINKLKKMFRQIQTKGTIDSIERNKQVRPEQKVDGNEANFGSVIQEMKGIFSKIESVFDYLKPVNPIGEPIAPPILV